jgi:glycosyltransferase involved in cell wall biosynthesis
VVETAQLVGPSIMFAFVGEGPMKAALVEQVEQLGLDNVRFHPQVPMVESPAFLASSDVLLVPLSAHPTFERFVPSKLVDYMAVGRPVVLSAGGEAARLVRSSGAGVVVPPEDPPALAAALTDLAGQSERMEEMGARGRTFARGRLRSVQAERLEQVLLETALRR